MIKFGTYTEAFRARSAVVSGLVLIKHSRENMKVATFQVLADFCTVGLCQPQESCCMK